MADITELISQYGYWALFVGCLAEGETITMLGGAAAHQGLLALPWVLAVVAASTCLSDNVLFFIGRYFGDRVIARLGKYQQKIARVTPLINKHPTLIVLGVRFMYGLRILGPLLIGASKLSPGRFVVLNVIGSLLWTGLFVFLGYSGSHAITWLTHQGLATEWWLVLALLLLLLFFFHWRWQKKRR